jgi:hypothetical protein
MFDQVLSQCEQNVLSMTCCHGDERICNCNNCLHMGFWVTPDTYDCEKKNNYYVLKYGSSYISEIYHYLDNSQIIESFGTDNINILSLGCGFCPDYYAISQYIIDKKLTINFHYHGLDQSAAWNTTRLSLANSIYTQTDLLEPFSFQNFHIIMLNKVFSTIFRHEFANNFLLNLINAIGTSMQNNSILVFNDINHIAMGRDLFDKNISPLFHFSNIRKYYTNNPPYIESTWKKIPQNFLVFPVTALPFVEPVFFINRDIFFEYRK